MFWPGSNVLMALMEILTGTDEHGQKVQAAAEKAGISPQQFTDTVSQNFRDLLGVMNFSNDQFIRTTEPRHYEPSGAVAAPDG